MTVSPINARGSDLSMADLLDPVALEARLVEARARRAVALAARSVAQPPSAPLSTVGTAPVPRPATVRPALHRLGFIVPVLLAIGLGWGGAVILSGGRHPASPPIVALIDPPVPFAARSFSAPVPQLAAGITQLPDLLGLAALLAPRPNPEVPLTFEPQPLASGPAGLLLGKVPAPLGKSVPTRSAGMLPIDGGSRSATEPAAPRAKSGDHGSRMSTAPTSQSTHTPTGGVVKSTPSSPSARTPTTRPTVAPSTRSHAARNGSNRTGAASERHRTGAGHGQGSGRNKAARSGDNASHGKSGNGHGNSNGGGKGHSDKGGKGSSGKGGKH